MTAMPEFGFVFFAVFEAALYFSDKPRPIFCGLPPMLCGEVYFAVCSFYTLRLAADGLIAGKQHIKRSQSHMKAGKIRVKST